MIRTLGARHRPANQALGPSMVNWLPFRRSRRSARPGFPTPPVVLRAGVLALAVPGRRIVDLEEELQDVPVGGPPGIKDDLHRLGMARMVVIGRVLVLPAGVADAGGDHPITVAQQLLHSPETAPGEDRRLGVGCHGAPLPRRWPCRYLMPTTIES